MTIAVGCGSRGIANIAECAKQVIAELKALGAKPFIFPAMGSHGGATAEGQREVLEGYGITESYVGCPIRATMDVVELGKVDGCRYTWTSTRPRRMAWCWFAASSHTQFPRAHRERHRQDDHHRHGQDRGATELHNRHGLFGELLPKAAKFILSKKNFLCGGDAGERATRPR